MIATASSKFSADLRLWFGFTPTEAVVAALLTEGLAYSEIAKLHVSYHTVHTHTNAIHRKAGVPTTGRLTALIRAAEHARRPVRTTSSSSSAGQPNRPT